MFNFAKLQPDLSGNPFFDYSNLDLKYKTSAKKDWERKAEIAAKK